MSVWIRICLISVLIHQFTIEVPPTELKRV